MCPWIAGDVADAARYDDRWLSVTINHEFHGSTVTAARFSKGIAYAGPNS